MSKYDTRQRRLLLDYLNAHHDEYVTASEIAASLAPEGMSKSAVYRNLAELEGAGSVERVTRKGVRGSLYRFAGASECQSHIHLSCSGCGRTFHLDEPSTKVLINNVKDQADFTVDKSTTVLYGLCKECKESQ